MGSGPARGARHAEPAAPARAAARPSCCWRGRARWTATRRIGRNKPFKDLAWGLASRGVAVLRFDKVTYAHPAEVERDPGFTLADEYLPHALAAIGLLRQHPAVDAARVFVPGHSLGGTVAPASRRPSRRSPGWSSWPAVRSRCTGPPSGRSATSPRWTPPRPPPSQPAIEALTAQASGSTAPTCRRRRPPSRAAVRRARPVLAGPARLRPGRGRGGARQADPGAAGRARLPGDRGRRPRPVAGGLAGPPGRHDPRLPGRQPLLLPRGRPVQPRPSSSRPSTSTRRSSTTSPTGWPGLPGPYP